MGVSQSYISDVLTDKNSPSVDLCLKIADVLEEAPENVFRLAGLLPDPQEESSLVVEILGLCRQLEKDEQKQLRDYARFLLNKQRGIL